MLSVQEATQIVVENCLTFGDEQVPLHLATGRVLREDLVADRDFPPFDRVTMDGIAIAFEAFSEGGQRSFHIAGVQAAGSPPLVLPEKDQCIEVMTGAMLPQGTDTVVRYEDLHLADGVADIALENVQFRQNIHPQGGDRRMGERIVKKGVVVSPAEIGVAATLGKTQLWVAELPKVAIISTGDELVEVAQTPLPYQIRRSNVHSLAATLARWGIVADLLHLPDDRPVIESALARCLDTYDALILSGGVSMGKFDYLPIAFEALGVKKLFHQVSQRPGKPFWFGRGKRTVVFALPGNPVSTFMCAHRYFQPWLRTGLGLPAFEHRYAVLGEDYVFKPPLTYFLQVKLSYRPDGTTLAMPITGQGSGDLANLADTDAFLELPLEQQDFKQGQVFPVWLFREA